MKKYTFKKSVKVECCGYYDNEEQGLREVKKALREKIGDSLDTTYWPGDTSISIESPDWAVYKTDVLTRGEFIQKGIKERGFKYFIPNCYIKGNKIIKIDADEATEYILEEGKDPFEIKRYTFTRGWV